MQFRTTFAFDSKFLWNAYRYRQAKNCVINGNSSRVEQKNLVDFVD